MRSLLLFATLILFAAVNLVMNYWVPSGLKLLLVPAFAVGFVMALRKAFGRPG